jgi:hypothetical protein
MLEFNTQLRGAVGALCPGGRRMTARTKNSDLADVLELLLACRISPHEFHSMVADAQGTTFTVAKGAPQAIVALAQPRPRWPTRSSERSPSLPAGDIARSPSPAPATAGRPGRPELSNLSKRFRVRSRRKQSRFQRRSSLLLPLRHRASGPRQIIQSQRSQLFGHAGCSALAGKQRTSFGQLPVVLSGQHLLPASAPPEELR